MSKKVFTSESVSEGHPDKVADQVSDAIVDALIAEDPNSRVACETLIKTGMVVVAGEIRTTARPDIEKIVRGTIADIGYDDMEIGFDASSVLLSMHLASNPLTLRWVSTSQRTMSKVLEIRDSCSVMHQMRLIL